MDYLAGPDALQTLGTSSSRLQIWMNVDYFGMKYN